MNAYKFHSQYGSHTKYFANDNEAFAYNSELSDDASCAPIHRFTQGDWFIWDIQNQTWVYDQQETQKKQVRY